MRLMKWTSLELEEFLQDELPKYYILSHTWGPDEITFQDIIEKSSPWRTNQRPLEDREAFKKIEFMSDRCKKDGICYFWIDTCNIDKSSSAELSEAINSMFHWYRGAEKCYAYLTDLEVTPEDANFEEQFCASRWFTRGWTLQELIAPKEIHFYNSHGRMVGSKMTLSQIVSEITHIDTSVLLGHTMLSKISIAKRMSWAASRKTSRTEDMAYSLMGIFNINMPLLYGEGGKAFFRLQEEIIRETYDLSIFAWDWPSESFPVGAALGVLASSPKCFKSSSSIKSMDWTYLYPQRPKPRDLDFYSITNRGIRIQLPFFQMPDGTYAACLGLQDPVGMISAALPLHPTAKQDGCFGRAGRLVAVPNVQVRAGSLQVIFLTKYGDDARDYLQTPHHTRLRFPERLTEIYLHRYVTIRKPIDEFTMIQSFSDNLETRLCKDGFVDFDNDRLYATIIQFAHVGRLPGFALLVESINGKGSFGSVELSRSGIRAVAPIASLANPAIPQERGYKMCLRPCRYNENLMETLMHNLADGLNSRDYMVGVNADSTYGEIYADLTPIRLAGGGIARARLDPSEHIIEILVTPASMDEAVQTVLYELNASPCDSD